MHFCVDRSGPERGEHVHPAIIERSELAPLRVQKVRADAACRHDSCNRSCGEHREHLFYCFRFWAGGGGGQGGRKKNPTHSAAMRGHDTNQTDLKCAVLEFNGIQLVQFVP